MNSVLKRLDTQEGSVELIKIFKDGRKTICFKTKQQNKSSSRVEGMEERLRLGDQRLLNEIHVEESSLDEALADERKRGCIPR